MAMADLRYLMLPAIALGVAPLALLARTTRAAVLEIMNADFVRTARSKGMSERRVVHWHLARNALVIVLTTIGLQFGTVIGQAVVVEKLFAWPGLGSLLVDSVTLRDIPGRAGRDPADRPVLSSHQHPGRCPLRDHRSAHQVHLRTRMKIRANLLIGGVLFATVIMAGLLAPLLAHTDPVMDANLMYAEEPPGGEFWFGTDAQGRDIYSRVLYGARISLTVGIVSQLINTVIGVCLGLSAGYWGGWWDDFVNGLTNMMLAIPSLIFALAIMAILNPGLTSSADRARPHQLVVHLPPRPRLGAVAQEPGLRAGRESAGLRRHPHHADAASAQYAGTDHRHRHARHGRCGSGGSVACRSSASASGHPSRAGAACCPMRATRSPRHPGSRSFPASRSS